jgi:transposase
MDIDIIKEKFDNIWHLLNERQRRIFAASEAKALGHGGITLVSDICGLSRVTITKGIAELKDRTLDSDLIRHPGAGRPALEIIDDTLIADLETIVDETTRGDPESWLRWTLKSTRNIASELVVLGHEIRYRKVGILLNELGYSLKANTKTMEGKQHEDRNEQFLFINKLVKTAVKAGQPVLSVDTKKKELVGNYKNNGQQWRKKGNPEKVDVHDFPGKLGSKAIPYGIYDIGQNTGFVNIGTDHDTSTFAVNSIRGWWQVEGKKLYPSAKYLVITADGGGSNGYRIKLWKYELHNLSQYLNMPIKVSHFPPGTSKWNKVEHNLFSFISSNWRGEPLCDYETVVKLINHTTTASGLKVKCRLERRKYRIVLKVTEEQMKSVKIVPNKFYGKKIMRFLNNVKFIYAQALSKKFFLHFSAIT